MHSRINLSCLLYQRFYLIKIFAPLYIWSIQMSILFQSIYSRKSLSKSYLRSLKKKKKMLKPRETRRMISPTISLHIYLLFSIWIVPITLWLHKHLPLVFSILLCFYWYYTICSLHIHMEYKSCEL